MGMFDDLEISARAQCVPDEYRNNSYQTKSLDCDGSLYRVDSTGFLLKIVSQKPGLPERLYHSKNLSLDINISGLWNNDLILQVRNGEVVGFYIDRGEAGYWNGQEALWEEFLEL